MDASTPTRSCIASLLDAGRARRPTGSAARRVFQTGLVMFSLGLLLCSLAPIGGRLASRALQAIGGSMLNPVAHVDHREHVHRTEGQGPRDRRVGRGVSGLPGARARCPRGPGPHRSAGGRSSAYQPAGRTWPRSCSPRASCRSREPRPRAALRPGRAAARHPGARRRSTFAIIEGPQLGWGVAADDRRVRRRARGARHASCPTSCAATIR